MLQSWRPRLCFYQRLSVSLVAGFFIVIAVLTMSSTYLQTNMKHEGEQMLHLQLAEHLVSDNPLLQQGVYDYEALKNLFHTLMVLGPSFEFYFVDARGQILTYSAKEGEVVREEINLEPVYSLLGGDVSFPLYGDDPKSSSRQKIFSAAPVYNEDQLQGYLYVIIGGAQYDSIVDGLQQSKGMQQFVIIVLSGLAFLLFALLLLFKFFTAPLKRLSDDMDRFRNSGFDLTDSGIKLLPWKDDSRNEIQRLGYSFNEILKHIDQQWQQIKSNDSQRRTLLADLSHDLRTPLANLQGYVETLHIKGEQLSEQDRMQFLEICAKNLQNLKRLIDQIFELAYLESGHINIKSETFQLAELLYDIAAKFRFMAENKHIKIEVELDKADIYVHADIEKLERVMSNLIDNAIRHTPENGKVRIHTISSSSDVKIMIADTGVGIASDELQRIFDARYQASNTERDAGSNVGLGLAISKKLISLFDSKLEVSSELGCGTTFSFSLKPINQA